MAGGKLLVVPLAMVLSLRFDSSGERYGPDRPARERGANVKHVRRKHYRGWTIERTFPSGFYLAWFPGKGRCMADTLAGIRELVDEREDAGR